MKYFWRVLLLLMLLVPTALLLAVVTEQGSRVLLVTVHRLVPSLELEYGSGVISGELHIKRLRYQVDGMRLELDNIITSMAPRCLWRSAICFSRLQAGHLDLALLPGVEDKSSPQAVVLDETDAPLIIFPVSLELDSVVLQSTRIYWQDGEWRQGLMQLQLRINESTLDVLSAAMTEPRLELRESTVAEVDEPGDAVLSRIDLPLELRVQKLFLIEPAWDFYGARNQLDGIQLKGHWLNSKLQLVQLAANRSDLGELSMHGAVNFTGDWPLQANLALELAESPQWAGFQRRNLTASVEGNLSNISLQLASPGAPVLVMEAQANVLDSQLPFSAVLNVSSADHMLLADIEGMPELLAGVQLESPLTMSATGTLSEQQFELQATASGLGYQSLEIALAGNHAQGLVVVDDLSLRDLAGVNHLDLSGEVSLAEPTRWSVALDSDGFNLPGGNEYLFGRLSGSLQFKGLMQGDFWEVEIAEVDMRGDINDRPALVSGFAGIDSGLLLSNSQLEADLNGARLSLHSSGKAPEPARMTLEIDHLGRWQPGSQGKLQLQALMAAGREQFQLSGTLQNIGWQGMLIESGVISGDYRAQADPLFNLDAQLGNVALGGVALSTLQLLAQGTASDHSISLSSSGDVGADVNVTGGLLDQQWQGRLSPTSVHTPQGSWRLPEPVKAAWSSSTQQLALDNHCWRQQAARICMSDMILGRHGGGRLEMTGDMGFLAGLLPSGVELEGEVQLELEGNWDPDQGFVARGRSQTRSITLTQHYSEGEHASISWDRGDAAFDLDGTGLKLGWELQREGRKVLGLDLLLPPDRNESMAGTVSLERLQLAALRPFAPALSVLEGELSGQLQLSGTVDQPLAHGMLSLSGGQLAMVGNPTELAGVGLNLDFQGDRAKVDGKGVLGGGELQLAGDLRLRPELGLALSVVGEQHTILYPPSTELLVSENLQLEVGSGLLNLTGEITVHEGVLEFEQLPAGSVALSADVVQVDYAGNVIREELPFDIAMDVQVGIRDRFKVTGNLLQVTLGGDLHLSQQAGQPLQLFGSLNTVAGELRAYQQRLQVKRGRLSFSGIPDNPTLDVRAERAIRSSNVTVGVQVQGPLQEDLILEVYSDPVMSQGDAMSYLVRGRGLDSGAGADGTAVALSMASGVVNRSTLVSELNRIPGISNVEFGAKGSEDDTAATVSGYIGGRIYLSYGFGLYEPINVLTARLYLRTRLWLEVVSSLENSVDLYYSFDID